MVSLCTFGLAAAALALLTAAHPAAAQTTLLSDTFNSENGGAGQLSYTGFANFNVCFQRCGFDRQRLLRCPARQRPVCGPVRCCQRLPDF